MIAILLACALSAAAAAQDGAADPAPPDPPVAPEPAAAPESPATPQPPPAPPGAPAAPPDTAAPGAATGRPPDAPRTWARTGADARYVFGRPAHLDAAGWTKLGVGIGVGGALYAVRADVRDWSQDHQDQVPGQVLNDARLLGRAAAPLLLAGGFYLAGVAGGSEYRKETSIVLLENLAFASAITGVAQRVLATERPRYGNGIEWFGAGGGHSVSGDVTVAASVLAPIIDRHLLTEADDSRAVRAWKHAGTWGLYGTAGLVALQRIHANAHYLPDVYFGYLNGLAVGRMIVDARRGGRDWRDERRARRAEVALGPAGISISWP
jgi:membrane-associated phospholipid phosphatase